MIGRAKRKPYVNEEAYSPPQAIDTLQGTQYKPVWERRRQPSPGVQAYAWETIALAAFSPIGPGVHAISRRPHAYYYQPAYAFPGVVAAGIPLIAGQFVLQPLIDPAMAETNMPAV